MLEKQTALDRIEILSNQTIVARYVVSVMDDGLLLTEQAKTNYIRPGDDYSAEDAKVQTICAFLHTPELIATYQASLEAPKAEV
jgi:hypothetical protein